MLSVVASQVAKTGDMKIVTPTATMGIRGTSFTIEVQVVIGETNSTTGSPTPRKPQTLTFHGTLEEINEAFASGVTYLASEQAGPTDSDAVTFTVEDALGATDTVNFIFNVTGA